MHFPTVKGRREWIILAIWIAHIILLLFCNEPAKKLYGVCTLTDEPSPSPHLFQYAFSWATPPLFKYMSFMDDPMRQLFETMFCETLCETIVCETMFGHYALKGEIWNSGMSFWSQKWNNCANCISRPFSLCKIWKKNC